MKAEWLEQLETPCIVINMEKTKENIWKMQREADEYGCKLRPHIKTHKMPLFAKMQLEAGAAGITCAKISEAEVMAEGGADDIFLAYPQVGKVKIKRAIALAQKDRGGQGEGRVAGKGTGETAQSEADGDLYF